MDKIIINSKVRYKFRGDTEENLQRLNPILALKEPCLILDENNKAIGFKIGDGVSSWNDLEEHNFNGNASIEIDQIYNPESENAQSGKAVAQVVEILEESITNKEQYIFSVIRENYVSKEQFDTTIGDISTALDELHTYAQALVTGGATE